MQLFKRKKITSPPATEDTDPELAGLLQDVVAYNAKRPKHQHVVVTDAGVFIPAGFNRKPEVSRNDPCPCGSGKKYKKCCMGS